MSTCQIEVVEFGQEIERPWLRDATGEMVIRGGCLCVCNCTCFDSASDTTNDKYDSMA